MLDLKDHQFGSVPQPYVGVGYVQQARCTITDGTELGAHPDGLGSVA